jgi:hypothetical protein
MRAYRLTTAAAAVLSSALALPLSAQEAAPVYDTPQAALEALFDAITAGDAGAAVAAMDPAAADLVQADDPEAVAETLSDLAGLYLEGYRFVPQGPDAVVIELGADGWPFPVPILRADDGWRFDAETAREELLARQIGANELDVIDILDAYVDIQREYRGIDHDGDGVMEFASAILSSEGRRDGLYWQGGDSPVGDVAARASLDGFDVDGSDEGAEPYAGYFFRILTAQGDAAPGGAMSYLVNGNMVAGHALLAVPAIYGETGVHTFMVGENGVALQADLGPDSLDAAFDITAFDPGEGWEIVTME